MADGTVLKIEDVQVHSHSGHISIKVKSVTTRGQQSWDGPVRTYGVDAAAFQTRFQGDLEQLKAWIKSQHTGHHGVHNDLVAALQKLKGETL